MSKLMAYISYGYYNGPSYANLFVRKFVTKQVFSNINFLVNTTAPNLNSTAVTLTTASALPPLLERSSLNL